MATESEESDPLLPLTQADVRAARDTLEGTPAGCCPCRGVPCDPLRLCLTAAYLLTTLAVLLSLWAARSHSCHLSAEFSDARALEAAADAFQPTNATLHALHLHLCSDCHAFGALQPPQAGWLEGEFTYNYSGRGYRSDRLAAATPRGHLSQYTRLKRALDGGDAVTAWVDPQAPGAAVLDRRHYVGRVDADRAGAICMESTLLLGSLLLMSWVPLAFAWMAPSLHDANVLVERCALTLLSLWMFVLCEALLLLAMLS